MDLMISRDAYGIKDIKLKATKEEDEDFIDRARKIVVQNPVFEFAKDVKDGKYDDLSFDDFEDLFDQYKTLSKAFKSGKTIDFITFLEVAMKMSLQYSYSSCEIK